MPGRAKGRFKNFSLELLKKRGSQASCTLQIHLWDYEYVKSPQANGLDKNIFEG